MFVDAPLMLVDAPLMLAKDFLACQNYL